MDHAGVNSKVVQHGAARLKLSLGLAAACFLSLISQSVLAAPASAAPAAAAAAAGTERANFHGQLAPIEVQHMADWVAASHDNGILPFVIVDKPDAKVFVFDQTARLLGSAWALVGLAPGDDSVPGIGTMPLAQITPPMRTTPAGRFVASLGNDLGKLDVLWVDYKDAISLHRVINTDPTERRLERIVSPLPSEHRISYGCINVPAKFFDTVVDPTFKGTKGVVYILPEVHKTRDVFPRYFDVDAPEPVNTPAPVEPAPNPVASAAAYHPEGGSLDDHDLPGIVH